MSPPMTRSAGIADRDQLERAFRSLSVDHRAVVVLHHYLDLPLAEVADVLGIPVGTAGSRLHYAMKGAPRRPRCRCPTRTPGGHPMNRSEAERARAIRAWLDEGSTELSPRVLDGVLRELPRQHRRTDRSGRSAAWG